jgi:hypothetical protein
MTIDKEINQQSIFRQNLKQIHSKKEKKKSTKVDSKIFKKYFDDEYSGLSEAKTAFSLSNYSKEDIINQKNSSKIKVNLTKKGKTTFNLLRKE